MVYLHIVTNNLQNSNKYVIKIYLYKLKIMKLSIIDFLMALW